MDKFLLCQVVKEPEKNIKEPVFKIRILVISRL